ncbi:SDR family NAD(P)-dependent oxidoreductase, partial [Proteus mirabilis]
APKAARGVDFMHLDVTSLAACEQVDNDVVKQYGKLDILCSNTGIFPHATIKEMSEADWEKMHTVNLKGMFFLVKAAL